MMLDPSCSGSGMLRAVERLVDLPPATKKGKEKKEENKGSTSGKGDHVSEASARTSVTAALLDVDAEEEEADVSGKVNVEEQERLQGLADFQLSCILHAFSFPQVAFGYFHWHTFSFPRIYRWPFLLWVSGATRGILHMFRSPGREREGRSSCLTAST